MNNATRWRPALAEPGGGALSRGCRRTVRDKLWQTGVDLLDSARDPPARCTTRGGMAHAVSRLSGRVGAGDGAGAFVVRTALVGADAGGTERSTGTLRRGRPPGQPGAQSLDGPEPHL